MSSFKNSPPIYRHLEEYSVTENTKYAYLFSSHKEASFHKHCDFYEFSLIFRGCFTNEYNGISEHLPKNTLVFFKKGTSHAIKLAEETGLHFSFIIHEEYFEKQFASFFPDIPLSLLDKYQSTYLTEAQSKFMADLSNKLSNNTNFKYRDQLANLFMYTALMNIVIPDTKKFPENHSGYYSDLLLQRFDNFDYVHHSVNQIYRDYPINKVALINSFKELTGSTIIQYQNKKKAEYAAQLLRSTEYSITEIGMQLNFSSPSHFTKMFQAHHGITPKKYKQMHTGKV